MFLGTYRHTVDAKGRLAIPARLREGLSQGSVISKGAEGCLRIYPPEEWAREQAEQRLTSLSPAEARRLTRMTFGAARAAVRLVVLTQVFRGGGTLQGTGGSGTSAGH